MMLTIEQKQLIQELKKIANKGDNACWSYSERNPIFSSELVTEDFADAIMSISPVFLHNLPVEKCSKNHFQAYIRLVDSFGCDDIISMPHIFGTVDNLNEELAYYIIDHAHDSITSLVDFYYYDESDKELDDKFFEYAMQKQLGSLRLLFLPNKIPQRLVRETYVLHTLHIDPSVAKHIDKSMWTENTIMLITQLNPTELEHIPYGIMTEENHLNIIENCPLAALKLDESLVTDDMLIKAMNVEKKMHQVYSSLKPSQLSKAFIERIIENASLYSASYFDDLIKNDIEFNPIDMFLGKYGSPSCASRIKKHFSKEQLLNYVNKTSKELTDNDLYKLEKHLELTKKEPVFMCPCCNNPLPQSLIDAIKNS